MPVEPTHSQYLSLTNHVWCEQLAGSHWHCLLLPLNHHHPTPSSSSPPYPTPHPFSSAMYLSLPASSAPNMTCPTSLPPSNAYQPATTTDRDAQETWLQQAATKLGNQMYSSLQQAATAHNVPELTLWHQMHGQQGRLNAPTDLQSLTSAAEIAIVDCIQCCTCSSYPLTLAQVCDYANTISCTILGHSQPIEVGCNWMKG